MKSEIVDVNETRRDLTVEVPSTVVDEAIGRAAAQFGRSRASPGLPAGQGAGQGRPPALPRPDHAGRRRTPRGKAVGDALNERGVEPVDTPDIQDLMVEEGKPLTFKAAFDVVPSFDPGDLGDDRGDAARGRRWTTRPWTRRSSGCASAPRVSRRSRPASSSAAIPWSSSLERQGTDKDGRRAKVDKHEQVSIELGAPSNPPGFDAEMIGMAPGATQVLHPAPIPTTTPFAELAGSKVDYTVTLKEIKQRVVPPLDDELAKDLGEFDSLDALRDARARRPRARGHRTRRIARCAPTC